MGYWNLQHMFIFDDASKLLPLLTSPDFYYYYYYFLLPILEKVLFLGQIIEMKILKDLHVLRSPESEYHIFSVWSVCMCVCLCVCVCVSVISINQKQTTAESSYLTFYICVVGRCYLKLFIKIEQKLCVQWQ